MRSVVVVGAGRVGATVAELLAATGEFAVTALDRDEANLTALGPGLDGRGPDGRVVDLADGAALTDALTGAWAVISAAPYSLTATVARAAAAAGAHYLDPTEDVATTRLVRALASGAPRAFIPQCGLAPGFVSIAAAGLAAGFEQLDQVRLRVGALPRFPTSSLGYALTWSLDGVINEYIQPCEAVIDGNLREVAALDGLERFTLDGIEYEAFNTSGGLGTLAETYAGRVRTLDYKTMRYPGHRDAMMLLINELGLGRRRDVLRDILEGALPETTEDVVVIAVTVRGWQGGRLRETTYTRNVYGQEMAGKPRTAIQATTAAGICAVLDLLAQGALPQAGFIRQEQIPFEAFLANRFGGVYA